MDQNAGNPGHSTYCYTELAAFTINFLCECSPSCRFCSARKDNRGRCTDNPIFTTNALSAATLPIYPGLVQALNNPGLHTQWLVNATVSLLSMLQYIFIALFTIMTVM